MQRQGSCPSAPVAKPRSVPAIGHRPGSPASLARSGIENYGLGSMSPAGALPPTTNYGLGTMSPTGSLAPTTDSRAANFVPKLLGKLAALEDKVNQIAFSKVDVSTYQRDKELASAREEALLDEIRLLKDACTVASNEAREASATLASKADKFQSERNQKSIQDLTALAHTKADQEVVKQLQGEVMVAESNVEQMQRLLTQKAEAAMSESQGARMDQFVDVLHSKVDNDALLQVQSELVALETTVDRLNRLVAEKADVAAVQHVRKDMQDLSATIQGKCDADAFRQLQSEYATSKKASATLNERLDSGCVTLETFELLQEDMRQLLFVVNDKADAAFVRKIEVELSGTGSVLEEVKCDLEVRRNVEQDLLQKVERLQQTSQNLQELSHILMQTKADTDSVPLLHVNVLDQI